MGKSLLPVLAASMIIRRYEQRDWHIYLLWLCVGFAAVLGHMFSIFLKFKGGKGVATSAGLMLGLFPYFTVPGLIAIAVFLLVFLIWRIISLASILSACAFPIIYLALGLTRGWPVFGDQWPLLVFASVIALMITVKHRSNIARLLAGQEKRFGSPAAVDENAQ